MRLIITSLICFLLGAQVCAAANEAPLTRRDVQNYAEKVRRLLVHAAHRQPFPIHGEAYLRLAVCRSGKAEAIDVRSSNRELRAFVYRHVLVTRFPKPPASFPECVTFGVQLVFHAD